MERNSFKEYSVFAMMSKEEQQPMKAQCEHSGTEALGIITRYDNKFRTLAVSQFQYVQQ